MQYIYVLAIFNVYVMKTQVKQNLENLFNQNYDLVKDASIDSIFSALISRNPEVMEPDLIGTYRYSRREMEILKKAKADEKLARTFELAQKMNFSYPKLIEGFKKDILNSMKLIKKAINKAKTPFKNQAIFLEYNYQPVAAFTGYGEGDYPILEIPAYFDFDCETEMYLAKGRIYYANFWQKMRILNETLENLEANHLIWESKAYQGLKEAYRFKTYLLLYEAFDELGFEIFEGIPIQKPLYIYGNEHDCERINVYVYE